MNVPEELKYTKEHEWLRSEGDLATVGITDYAQSELGDIVFVELPQVGDAASQGEPFGTIEAVKTVADLFSPVSGEVSEVNPKIEEDPAVMNKDPYGEGWMIKVKMSDASQADSLLSPTDYRALIEKAE
ncbi:MAG: glycine cleavage system protein H [candidate division Zixibacteria bacterium DG_27]|nr:MAG: glycine cleavage system protein H [candidate division Zixibacteria bacterium DG_27]